MPEVIQSYASLGVDQKEDVLDLIQQIDPVNNFFISNLGSTEATATRHEWLEDNLPAGNTITARAENFTPSWGNLPGVLRKANILQIISSEFKVSKTQQLIEKHGIKDRMAYEQDRAMKHWANLAEYSVMHATLVSGTASGATRTMQGIKWYASLTSRVSGVSLSETMFNDFLQDAYARGVIWDTVVVPASLKRRISGFTAGTTKFTDAFEKKLVNVVSVYEGDFGGMIKIIPHRWAIGGADASELIFVKSDSNYISYLDRPHFEDYAKTTDGINGLIRGELTVEVRNGYGVGYYWGLR